MCNQAKSTPVYNREVCGSPLSEHIGYLFSVTAQGAGCNDTYKALVELAEFYRAQANFEPYRAEQTELLLAQWKAAQEDAQNLLESIQHQQLVNADLPAN